MDIRLKKIQAHELELFRREMQRSFTQGVIERFGTPDDAPIPSVNDLDEALDSAACDVFIITADGSAAGGTIIKRLRDKKYSLELLFIFKDFLNKKIGSAAWEAIEKHYSDAEVWETCTPYFDRRNIHFYVNKCQFTIVEFFCEAHSEEHAMTEEFRDINASGFFRFEKVMQQNSRKNLP